MDGTAFCGAHAVVALGLGSLCAVYKGAVTRRGEELPRRGAEFSATGFCSAGPRLTGTPNPLANKGVSSGLALLGAVSLPVLGEVWSISTP